MGDMKGEQFGEKSVVMAKLSQTLQPRIRLRPTGIQNGYLQIGICDGLSL